MSEQSEKGLLARQLEACRFNKCLLLLQCGKVGSSGVCGIILIGSWSCDLGLFASTTTGLFVCRWVTMFFQGRSYMQPRVLAVGLLYRSYHPDVKSPLSSDFLANRYLIVLFCFVSTHGFVSFPPTVLFRFHPWFCFISTHGFVSFRFHPWHAHAKHISYRHPWRHPALAL